MSKYNKNQIVDFRVKVLAGVYGGRGEVVGLPDEYACYVVRVKSWDFGRAPRHLPVGSTVLVYEDEITNVVTPTQKYPQIEEDGDILFA